MLSTNRIRKCWNMVHWVLRKQGESSWRMMFTLLFLSLGSYSFSRYNQFLCIWPLHFIYSMYIQFLKVQHICFEILSMSLQRLKKSIYMEGLLIILFHFSLPTYTEIMNILCKSFKYEDESHYIQLQKTSKMNLKCIITTHSL